MKADSLYSSYRRIMQIATVVALCVIVLGAWVRLSDAGLGCPDWPGCYGQVTWPVAEEEVAAANAAYPERPVETEKAWKEMVHRYLASFLGLLILIGGLLAWLNRDDLRQAVRLPLVLIVLVIFQGLLGMWTVTLQLKPVIVMAHLLGGLTTFGLLWWCVLRAGQGPEYALAQPPPWLRMMVVTALVVLGVQISLGGWVSANYAALACLDFPSCLGSYNPPADYSEAFVLWREIGVDYEGGVLDHPARVAVQWTHRIGALAAALVIGITALIAMAKPLLRKPAAAVLVLLTLQILIGIGNVVMKLPLWNAVAHNGVAALLLAAMIWLLHRSIPRHL